MSERIKPTISGSAETMLQSFYARAQYSKSKHNKFYDAKAVELVDKIDYDFSTAARDSTMGKGVIARTVVFDELVKKVEKITPDEIYNTKNNRLKDILGAGVKDEAIKENTKEKIDSVMNSYNKQKPKIKKVQLMFFGTIERKEGAVLFEEVISKHDIVIVDSGNGMVPAMIESIFDGEEKSTDARVVGLIKLIL